MNPAFKERILDFAVQTIRIASTLPKNAAGSVVARQLVRAATSIGANVEEAEGAFSFKDWLYCLNVAKKEAKETHYWLRLVRRAGMMSETALKSLEPELDQIISILTKSVKTAQSKSRSF